MNEIIKDYICQTSYKIVVNKLRKVLTYVICQQLDEMSRWCFQISGRWTTKLGIIKQGVSQGQHDNNQHCVMNFKKSFSPTFHSSSSYLA
jgi:hypothetical protein